MEFEKETEADIDDSPTLLSKKNAGVHLDR